MIVVARNLFEATCRSRGYDPAACEPCIVADDGLRVTVDETHAAYPRLRERPTLLAKAASFAASAAKHVVAGMPLAAPAQVAERFAICEQCQHYDGAACRLCGCPVKRKRRFVSKLSWAGEACPEGKWGPVSD
jgi:hypothetical protein